MKLIFVITILAFSSLASASTIFTCTSPDGMWIEAKVEVIDDKNYEVSLRNVYSQMPVHQKTIMFDEAGEIVAVETSALWESFSIHKAEGKWTGEYWYDNSHSFLTCEETK